MIAGTTLIDTLFPFEKSVLWEETLKAQVRYLLTAVF